MFRNASTPRLKLVTAPLARPAVTQRNVRVAQRRRAAGWEQDRGMRARGKGAARAQRRDAPSRAVPHCVFCGLSYARYRAQRAFGLRSDDSRRRFNNRTRTRACAHSFVKGFLLLKRRAVCVRRLHGIITCAADAAEPERCRTTVSPLDVEPAPARRRRQRLLSRTARRSVGLRTGRRLTTKTRSNLASCTRARRPRAPRISSGTTGCRRRRSRRRVASAPRDRSTSFQTPR